MYRNRCAICVFLFSLAVSGCGGQSLSLGETSSGGTSTASLGATNVPLDELVEAIGKKMGANVTLGDGVDGGQKVTVKIDETARGTEPEAWIAVCESLANELGLQFQINNDGSGYSLIQSE